MEFQRLFGCVILIVATFGFLPPPAPAQTAALAIPTEGVTGPGLEGIEQAVIRVMAEHQIPGASLAIAKNGSLVMAKAFGLADVQTREPVTTQTFFALASVSKSLTAVVILKLVEEGRLGLDTHVLKLLDQLEPLPGDEVDPRFAEITVRHLLLHAGGWNRKVSGDANSFSPRVAKKMQIPLASVGPTQLARYMLGQKLDFDPGTESAYSNFGYILLGLVIEKVTGVPYKEAMNAILIQPLRLEHVQLNHVRGHGYRPGEAHRYLSKGKEDREGGQLPITMASGGWLATPSDMVHFLTALDGTRGTRFLSEPMLKVMVATPPAPIQPHPNGSHFGLGWDQARSDSGGASYQKGGALAGVHAIIKHTAGGLDWAFLCNGGHAAEGENGAVDPMTDAIKAIESEIAKINAWPKIDLFERSKVKPGT